ncbi:MAG: hypothetical protein NTV63_00080 [Candidatus Woesearchaeota archaeon]|nr:hypothetical protein [Candidatus Woesearchaeota archaeon]
MSSIGGGNIEDTILNFLTVEVKQDYSILLHKQMEVKGGRVYFRIKKRILNSPFIRTQFASSGNLSGNI